ncbi:MAG: protein kinase [Pirellulales bacterium]
MSGQAVTVESIFLEAVEKASPSQREAFLKEACAGDSALRERVEALLKAHDDAGSFLATPAFQADSCETHVLHSLGANTPPLGDERVDAGTGQSEELSLDFLDAPRQAGMLGALGPYDITEFVGQGGMGVVLKAHDPRLNRVVAIKVLAPALASNATARKRFLREAQAAAAVTHDHVVAIYAIDEAKRLPYLVMEYVAGQSLQQKVDSAGPLEVKEIVRIGRQIAAGLTAAHEQGLIHRDIKPANILLENGVERVKITDFGLARAVGDVAVTQTGLLAGTPQYMSPEQAHGERVDYRSDLFSLGSVLYAMCTGRPPFRGESPVTVIRRVCEETPTPISRINPDVPDWLINIVDRLLNKNADRRFQSAAELVELLGQCLEHLQQPALCEPPVIAQPLGATSEAASVVSLPERRSVFGRTGRQRRWAAAALVLLLLGAGLGATEATGVTDVSGFVATVLRIRTPQGTLVVELNDPAASVAIDADDETITFSGIGPHEIKLRPGRHPVRALKDGKPVRTEWVTVTRGERQVVTLRLEDLDADSDEQEAVKQSPTTSGDEPIAGKSPAKAASALEANAHAAPLHAVIKDDARKGKVRAVALSAGRRSLAVGRDDGTFELWNLAKKSVTYSGKLPASVSAVALSANGQWIAAASGQEESREAMVHLWDLSLKENEPIPVQIGGGRVGPDANQWNVKSGQVGSLTFSPDGTLLAAGTGDDHAGELIVWSTKDFEEKSRYPGFDGRVRSLLIMGDNDTTMAGSGGNLQILQLKAGTVVMKMNLAMTFLPQDQQEAVPEMVQSFVFLSTERGLVATGDDRGSVSIFEFPRGGERLSFKAHDAAIESLAFSPDGSLLATASRGESAVKIWNIAEKIR